MLRAAAGSCGSIGVGGDIILSSIIVHRKEIAGLSVNVPVGRAKDGKIPPADVVAWLAKENRQMDEGTEVVRR